MKTHTVMHEVTSNAGESKSYTIKATGKAFKALINGLYADKVQSITREIWTNALDAHIMADCAERPFEVSFPTVFDPAFRVRDFGISLTHMQVMEMYTTLFESTKEGSDDENGKWGLGSKSPFAYADSFSVTVVMDGQKRFYAAMIGGDGIPTINFMGDEATDEENGVEVAFPVAQGDVDAFAKAARRVSHGFDVKPVVTNMGNAFGGWPELPVQVTGNGWKMLKGNIEGHRSVAYAKMGCVLYPINANAMGEISTEEREILNHTFVIDFNIGDLEITMSREELSYGRNEPTTASIRRKVAGIVEELKELAATRFAACRTFWEACILYNETVGDHSLPQFFRNTYARYSTWNGVKLEATFTVNSPRHYAEMMHFDNKQLAKRTVTFRPIPKADLFARKGTVFLFEDMSGGHRVKRASTRVRLWKESTLAKQAIWMRFHDRETMLRTVIELMERFDGAEFINIEDIALPVTVRQHYERRPVMVRVFDGTDFDNQIDLDEDDFEEGGIFVSLERMIPLIPTRARHPRYVIAQLRALGAIDRNMPIYGAPKSLRKKFDGEQWVDLYDFAREWLEDNGTDVDAMRRRELALSGVKNDPVLHYLNQFVNNEALTHADSPARDAVVLWNMVAEERETNSTGFYDLANALGTPISVDHDAPEDSLAALHAETVECALYAYPLLEVMQKRVSYTDNLVDLLTDYVNMCDMVSETNRQRQFKIAAE